MITPPGTSLGTSFRERALTRVGLSATSAAMPREWPGKAAQHAAFRAQPRTIRTCFTLIELLAVPAVLSCVVRPAWRTKREARRAKASSMRFFTLIELLVVIAIIAILMAMLMPALRSARDYAKTAVCINNLKQMSIGIHSYCNDFNDWFLPYELWRPEYGGWPWTTNECNVVGANFGPGIMVGQGYLSSSISFCCPSNTYRNSFWSPNPRQVADKFKAGGTNVIHHDYSINHNQIETKANFSGYRPPGETSWRPAPGWRRIAWPSYLPLMADAFFFSAWEHGRLPHQGKKWFSGSADGAVKYTLFVGMDPHYLTDGTYQRSSGKTFRNWQYAIGGQH